MKFSGALSTLLVVLPVLVLQAAALPSGAAIEERARGRGFKGGRFGGFGGKGGAAKGGAQGGAGAGAAASSAAASTAAAASSVAAASGAAASTAAATTAAAAAASSAVSGANNAAAGSGAGNAADEQSSLTLDPSTIGPNLAQNGLNANGSEAGQVASLTSTNNFINFCVGKTISNGLQIVTGSCNPVPMGDLPAKGAQPSCKFVSPTNLQNIAENTDFTITMAISNLETGNFVNPNVNYFGAPQQLNGQGQIVGHSHVVVQAVNGVLDTNPADPTVFQFFKGLNAPASNGQLTADVTAGLPAGTYRLFSINTAANHQPVIGPLAQHGSFDDAVYFTVGDAAASQAASDIASVSGSAGAAAAGAGAAASSAAGAGAAASSAAGAAASTAAGAAASSAAGAAATSAAAAPAASSAAAGGAAAGGAAAGGAAKGGKAAPKFGKQGGFGKGRKGRRSDN